MEHALRTIVFLALTRLAFVACDQATPTPVPMSTPTPTATPTPSPQRTPLGAIGDERFTTVSAGEQYTCGVKADDSVACWGWDEHGEATPPEGSSPPSARGFTTPAG